MFVNAYGCVQEQRERKRETGRISNSSPHGINNSRETDGLKYFALRNIITQSRREIRSLT